MMEILSQIVRVLGASAEFSLVAKATVTMGMGLLAVRLAGRARASTRHLILASTFGAVLLLVVGTILGPSITFDLRIGDSLASSSPRSTAPTALPVLAGGPVTVSGDLSRVRQSLPAWSTVIRTTWAIGAAFVLLWFGAALWRVSRVRRQGLPWFESSLHLTELAAVVGVRHPVALLVHEDLVVPATAGWRHPAILLPADAREWSDADVRRATVHELAHIRRRDWPVHVLGHLVCAGFWFHPLVWAMLRRLDLEAERACDDAVLEVEDGIDYAAQLVGLARRLSAREPAMHALAMANRSHLAARVAAVLDGGVARGRVPTLTATAVLVLSCVSALAVGPVRVEAVSSSRQAITSGSSSSALPRAQRATPLDRALVEAADEGDLDGLIELLNAGAHVNAVVEGDGSPLIAAARAGSLPIVLHLLDRGANPNLSVSGDGNPLIMAAAEGHVSVVELLLDRGALIDTVVPGDENALIRASGEGHLPVVKLLVSRGADVNARVWVEIVWERGVGRASGQWRTPLSMARRGRHAAVADFLISAGARE